MILAGERRFGARVAATGFGFGFRFGGAFAAGVDVGLVFDGAAFAFEGNAFAFEGNDFALAAALFSFFFFAATTRHPTS